MEQLDADPIKGPTRRWRLLKLAAIFVGLAGAFYLAFYLVSRTDLARAIAETDALDPGWRSADIEAARTPLPDAENAALVISAGAKLISKAAKDEYAKLWESDIGVHPEWRLTPKVAENCAAAVAAAAPGLAEFRKLSTMPRGRWHASLAAAPGERMPIDKMTDARQAMETLRYDAYDRIEAGDLSAAAERVTAALNIGRSFADEPLVISTLVRIAIDMSTFSLIERLLGQLTPDDATLARLQQDLEAIESLSLFFAGLRGERAWLYDCFEHGKANPSMEPFSFQPPDRWHKYRFYVPGAVDRDEAAALRWMNRLLEIVKQPVDAWDAPMQALDLDAQDLPKLAASGANTMTRLTTASRRHAAYLRSVITSVAAERYRIKTGQWPNSLDDLVAEKILTKAPLDPFSGHALMWKTVADGRLIYSIGSDRVDDGGIIRFVSGKLATDIGVQLFDADKRRQTPPPTAPAADKVETP